MNITARNTINLLIGLDIARTANVQISDRANATTYLADGEIVVLGEDGSILAAGSTFSDSKYIMVVQRSGATASTSELTRSLQIDGSNVLNYRGRSYAAPQTQRYFIGYDGSAGSIEAIDNNDYKLTLSFKHDKKVRSQQGNAQVLYYSSDSTATQEEVAGSLARQIGNNVAFDVLAERLCNDAGAALVGNLLVTNGSKSVTTNSTETNISAGTYIRIGGTALTDPVYKVDTFSGTTITLDEEYQGASGATVTGEYITTALAAAADFGVRLTGKALTYRVGYFSSNQVAWDMALSNFGTTTTNNFREAVLGNGTYEQIADLEYFAQGFDGITDRVFDSSPTLRADATVDETYDMISLNWVDGSDQHIISGTKPSPNQLILAIPDGAAQSTNILAQLNPWMASLPKAFSAVSV